MTGARVTTRNDDRPRQAVADSSHPLDEVPLSRMLTME
jgi:hypothetical protein